MSLLFIDSFDHYATADILEKWSSSAVSGTGSTVTIGAFGRRGSGGFRWTTGTSTSAAGNIQKSFPSTNTVILGFSFNYSGITGSNGCALCSGADSSTIGQWFLRLEETGVVSFVRGEPATGTVLGTTITSLPIGIHNFIEVRVFVSNTLGTCEIRFNGIVVLSLTNIDTANSSTSLVVNSIYLGPYFAGAGSQTGTSRTWDFDDVYVCNGDGPAPYNDFLGDVRVDARFPTGVGATTGFTPSAGANWSNVDDTAPNDDTDYNAATTVGLTDTFITQDAPVVGATIHAIQHNISMKKMDAGVAAIAPIIRHSGVNNAGTNIGPSVGYGYGTQIATEIAPGVPITEANFNAAEFGYRKTV